MIIINYAFVGNTADQMWLLAYNHCTTQAFSVFRKRILKKEMQYSYSASVTNWMIMQLYLKMEIFLVLIQNHQVN